DIAVAAICSVGKCGGARAEAKDLGPKCIQFLSQMPLLHGNKLLFIKYLPSPCSAEGPSRVVGRNSIVAIVLWRIAGILGMPDRRPPSIQSISSR
ncbi:4606_t:CDS:2, partial [Funneliformis mosseae]